MPNIDNITAPIIANNSNSNNQTNITNPPAGGIATPPVMDFFIKGGSSKSSVRPFNLSDYENVIGKGKVNSNLEIDILNENRAKSQKWYSLLGNSVGQLGTTILGGTISGIGSLLNFPETAILNIENIFNKNAVYKWDNLINDTLGSKIQKIGIDIEEWGRSAMPIYQTKTAQEGGFAGGMGDATWWASMFPTIGSAAASLIPTIGSMKLLSSSGKLLQMLNIGRKAGNYINKAGSFLNNIRTQQVLGTLYGAHLDSMEEIARGYDEQFQYALGLGFTEDEARRFASVYASESYKDAWLYGVLFNAIELNALLRDIKTAPVNNVKIEQSLKRNIKGLARNNQNYKIEDFTDDLNRKLFNKTGLYTIKDLALTSLSEGAEEMRTDIALNEGVIAAKKELGIEDSTANLSPFGRAMCMVSQAQAWDSFIWGALGGGVMYGGKSAINKILNGNKEREYELQRASSIIEGIQSIGKTLYDYDGNMDITIKAEPILDENGNQILDENGSPKSRKVIEDPASEVIASMMSAMNNVNGFAYANEYFDQILNLSDEELLKAYTDIDVDSIEDLRMHYIAKYKRSIVESLKREFSIAQRIQLRNSGLTFGSKHDDILRKQASFDDYLLDYYTRQLSIVDTKLKEFDLQNVNSKNEVDKILKSISAKIDKLFKERESITNKINNLKILIKDYDDKLDSLNYDKTIKEFDSKIESANSTIQTLESEIDRLNQEIEDLNNSNEELGNLSINTKNRKDRDPYKLNIRRNKKSILENKVKINEILDKINSIKNEIEDINQAKLLYESEYEDAKTQSEYLNASLISLDQDLNTINSKISNEREKENSAIYEYEEKLNDLGINVNQNNREYVYNEDLYNNIQFAIESVKERIANRKDIYKKRGELLDKMFDSQEKLNENKDKNKEETEAKKEENNKSPEPIVTDIETTNKTQVDNNAQQVDVSDKESEKSNDQNLYALDENGVVNSVLLNGHKYLVGSKFNVAGSTKTIQKIELIEGDAGLDDVILLTIEDDTTKTVETVDMRVYNNENTTPYKKVNSSKKVTPSNFINKDWIKLTELDLFEFVNKISNLLNDKSSRLYRALNTPTNDTEIAKARLQLINFILNKLETSTKSNLSSETLNKIESIKKTLYNNINIIESILEDIKWREYLNNFIPNDSLNLTEESNAYIRELFNKYVNEIIPILKRKFKIENDSLVVIPNAPSDIDFSSSFINIANKLLNLNPNKVSNIAKTKLEIFISDINVEINSSIYNNYKPIILNRKSRLDKFINKIRNIINNKDNESYDVLTDDSKFGKERAKIINFYNAVNKFVEIYDSDKHTPTNKEIEELINAYNDVKHLINRSVSEFENLDVDDRKALRDNGILDFANHLYLTFNILADYYGNYRNLNFVDNRSSVGELKSINELVTSLEDFMNIDESENSLYSRNDIKYYISERTLKGFEAIYNVLNDLDDHNLYDPDHKYTFEDILDAMFQRSDGREFVMEHYRTIWDALIYFKNYFNINRELTAMLQGGVPTETVNKLKDLLTVLDTRIINPIRSVSSKHFNSDYILKDTFLKDFFKNHIQREFYGKSNSGLRRLTPKIFSELSDKKNYDEVKNIIKNNIEINGVTFTSKEVFEALQSLHPGQEFNVTVKDDTINISINVNGKELILETINVNDSNSYHEFVLSKTIGENNVIYDSAFGTDLDISAPIKSIIKTVSNSQKIFELVRDYYVTYYKAQQVGKQNDEQTVLKLIDILNKLDSYNNKESDQHSEIINAIINAVYYNTETEGYSSDKIPIDTLNLNKVFYTISPIFFGYRIENIEERPRHTVAIRRAYVNLNKKLSNDFNETKKLISTVKEKGSAILVLSGINKSPIIYGDSKNFRASVKNNIQPTAIINGKPQIKIVEKQVSPDNEIIVSSLTEGVEYKDPLLSSKITAEGDNRQMFAEIKSNDGLDGKSLIPLRRGNLVSDLSNSDYDKAALEYVIDRMSKLVSDATLTYHSTKKSKNKKSKSNTWTPSDAQTLNKIWDDFINELSNVIIVDTTRNEIDPNFFNVGSLWKIGDNTYSKKIEFITVNRTKKYKSAGTSYSNSINIKYKLDSNGNFIPISIELYRNQIPTTRRIENNKRVLGISKPGLTEKEIKSLNGTVKKHYSGRGEVVEIPITKPSDINAIFTSEPVRNILSNLQRAVVTKYNGIAYEYGIRHDNQFESVNGSYTPEYLSWAKKKGIISKNTKITFDSMQDFIFETNALTTTAQGIKNEDGEVLSNYSINSVPPAMFFTLKEEEPTIATNETTTEINTTQSEKNANDAKDSIRKLSEIKISNNTNWYKELIKSYSTKEKALEAIGVIPKKSTKATKETIVALYDMIYGYDSVELTIGSYDDKNKSTNASTWFDKRKKRQIIKINKEFIDNPIHTLEDIGNIITHETLHVFFNYQNADSDISNNFKPLLEPIINDYESLNKEDFNNKYSTNFNDAEYKAVGLYLSRIKTNYKEVITYTFTESAYAPLVNRIMIGEQVKATNKRNSLWNKILDTLLKILNIKLNKGSLTDNIKNIIINSIESSTNTNSNEDTNPRVSGRATHLPTGQRPQGAEDQVATDLFDNINKTVINNTTADALRQDFDNDEDLLLSENTDDIKYELSIAGRGVGYAPTSAPISNESQNIVENILKTNKKSVSSQSIDFIDFKDKYTDANNNKIC